MRKRNGQTREERRDMPGSRNARRGGRTDTKNPHIERLKITPHSGVPWIKENDCGKGSGEATGGWGAKKKGQRGGKDLENSWKPNEPVGGENHPPKNFSYYRQQQLDSTYD